MPKQINGDKPADRVKHLLGSLDSGIPDLAENHRHYVLESLCCSRTGSPAKRAGKS